MDDFVYAKNIFIYASKVHGEVDTKRIIDFAIGRGKAVFIPKLYPKGKEFKRYPFSSWKDLKLNRHGFYEPSVGFDDDMSDIDLIIVPCVAISLLGQRVGYGGGFYDRLLKKSFAPRYALAYEFQLFGKIETDYHDIRIDKVITERRVIGTRKAAEK